ncbi:MAG: hypothetical protein ACRD1H_10040 [Vicinamibacterales bacterium]
MTIVLAGLAACGGDSTPAASGGGTTPPVTGNVPDFSTSDCQSAALAIAAAVAGGFTGAGGSLDQSAAALGRMASGAPAEIKADIQTLATATQRFQAALVDAGVDFTNPNSYSNPEAAAKLQAASSEFEASGAKEAVDRVGAYFDQLCPGAR